MSRAIGRIGAIVGVVVVLVALVGGAYAIGLLGVPSVGGVDNRFAGVNETTTVIETDLAISNPNPIGLGLDDLAIDYTVWLNDVPLATGSKRGLAVERGNSTLTFNTSMSNGQIPSWWASHIRNGEDTTLQVEANVTSGLLGRSIEVTPVERPIETDILSSFNSTETRPVNADAPLVSDPVLYINETRAAWSDVSTARTPMEMEFVVYNPKPAPYVITEIRYDITMNEVAVGDGATTGEYIIQPGAERTIEATTAIENDALDAWWVTHLENDQVTELRIDFEATIELPGGQTVDVPLDALTYTETIDTDFFGNKDAESGESGPESNSTGGSTMTSADGTDDGGSSDETATESARATATGNGASSPTPTPTPEAGGLPIGDDTETDGS